MTEQTTAYEVGRTPSDDVWGFLEAALEQQRSHPEMLEMAQDLHRRHENLREERERIHRQYGDAQRALTDFKRRVRDKAIAVSKEESWCVEGLNEALESLGLEPYERTWKVSGTVKYEPREVSWTIQAATAEDAEEKLLALLRDDTDHSAFDTALDIDRTDLTVTEDD